MSALVVIALGLLGLFVGSVVWVLGRARATDRPLLTGPTCANPGCGAPLSPLAWLPLLGFGTVRRCPKCGAHQPVRRVLFEVAVAGYYATAAARADDGDGLELTAVVVFAVPLLAVLLVDWWTGYIHTDVIAVGFVLGLGFAAADGLGSLVSSVGAALVAVALFAVFFALAGALYRSVKVVPIGLGDVYLAAMIGAMVRFPAIIGALFAGILLAALGSILLLATRRAGRRATIPYGPYLCVGALLTLLP